MEKIIQRVRTKRIFSEEFKKQIVSDYEKGHNTVLELCRLYQIDNSQVYKWIYKYSAYEKKNSRIVEMKDSSTKKLKEMEKEIKKLKEIVGDKQIKIDFYEKMIEISKTDFGIDLLKKSNTPQSTGSKKTEKK